jgi:hypothetical protein
MKSVGGLETVPAIAALAIRIAVAFKLFHI